MTPLSLHASGSEVGALQQSLLESGLAVDPLETSAAIYGPSTFQAVTAYQKMHGLAPDGVAGPRTLAAIHGGDDYRYTADGWLVYDVDVPPRLVEVVRAAVGCIGTRETPPGSNRGPEIDRWCEAAGIPVGSAWCAAWATAMLQNVDGPTIPRLGSALKVREWGRQHGRLVALSDKFLPGDLFVIMRGPVHGHAGIIAGDDGETVRSVEGNAGDACRGLIRPRVSFSAVVRAVPG